MVRFDLILAFVNVAVKIPFFKFAVLSYASILARNSVMIPKTLCNQTIPV